MDLSRDPMRPGVIVGGVAAGIHLAMTGWMEVNRLLAMRTPGGVDRYPIDTGPPLYWLLIWYVGPIIALLVAFAVVHHREEHPLQVLAGFLAGGVLFGLIAGLRPLFWDSDLGTYAVIFLGNTVRYAVLFGGAAAVGALGARAFTMLREETEFG
ncbi:MAG: hypothetical protein ABEH90_03685 [Halolamina sp.]